MKWPLMSRAAHEAIVAEKEARIRQWDADYQVMYKEWIRVGAKYDSLLAQHLAVLHPPAPVVPPPAMAPERKPTSVIDDVIRLEAKDDMRLAKYLRKRARVLRGEHPQWTDGQIATELSRWETAEEMPPEFIMAGGAE